MTVCVKARRRLAVTPIVTPHLGAPYLVKHKGTGKLVVVKQLKTPESRRKIPKLGGSAPQAPHLSVNQTQNFVLLPRRAQVAFQIPRAEQK